MNSISWFIYLSDVIGNLQPVLGIGASMAVICAGLCLLFSVLEEWPGGRRIARNIMFGAVPAIFIACLIPSKTTMYAIAASQIGERMAANETVQGMANDATKAVQIWIKKQIEPAENSHAK